jgi:hypothetical protein
MTASRLPPSPERPPSLPPCRKLIYIVISSCTPADEVASLTTQALGDGAPVSAGGLTPSLNDRR